ncbi:MAG: TlyA family RNA methyltransferase [Oscillospiraceae bacterium]|nr:TlyA family RNA methyltransferase [Oscillospiraceae bacterium]
MKKVRLDQLLTDRGLEPSRERARLAIMEGRVFVDGQRVDKPGAPVRSEARLEKRGESLRWVSRGGLKLEKALNAFQYDPVGLTCLDCGASTGGFTDVLLQSGAKKVYAVDVGYGQLAWKLRQDARVVNLERTNVRYLTREQIPEDIDLAVMDLAFISIRLVLPAVHALLRPDGDLICLVKPQFEAGREKVGKKGVVRDPAVHLEVLERALDFFPEAGFTPLALDFSPIRGPEGNIEYLARLKKGTHPAPPLDPAAVVEASHRAFRPGEKEEAPCSG